jgi:hypothetical protein
MSNVIGASRNNSTVRFLGKALFVVAVLGVAVLAGPPPAMADSVGPFAGLAGTWKGVGKVVKEDGQSEKIACRASYTVSPDGINLGQSLVCASDSYRFDIKTDVYTDGTSLRGTWTETTRSASGNLEGEVRPGLIMTRVSAPGFSADVSVKTTGQKQIVNINPEDRTQIAQVSITLAR